VRLTAARLAGKVTEHLAQVQTLIAQDPGYATLFGIADQVARTWAGRKHDPALDLMLSMDDALRSNTRSGYQGCDEQTWSAFATAVASVGAARFGANVASEDRAFLEKAASLVLDDEHAYLAANALAICTVGSGVEPDYAVRTLAHELAFRPGFRGPRTATHTALLAANVTLDDRDATVQYPGVQRRWLQMSGDRGAGGQGVVASVKSSGNDVVISFAKEMSTYTECTRWKSTSRIDRIDEHGNIYYESSCTKYTTKKFDQASEPQTVAARYATGVTKGVYAEVVENVVVAARTKQGGDPIAVFGVAVK
jgi:hypothetical protein